MQFGASGQLVPFPTGGALAKDKLLRGGAWNLRWSLESWGRPCYPTFFWQVTSPHPLSFTWRMGLGGTKHDWKRRAEIEGGSLNLLLCWALSP